MQALVSSGDYDGVIWTQGSPQVEESAYWFNLLIDTTLPIAATRRSVPRVRSAPTGRQILWTQFATSARRCGPMSKAVTAAASW